MFVIVRLMIVNRFDVIHFNVTLYISHYQKINRKVAKGAHK